MSINRTNANPEAIGRKKNKMFREGVSDRDITYAFSFELEMGWGHGTDFSCKIPQEIN